MLGELVEVAEGFGARGYQPGMRSLLLLCVCLLLPACADDLPPDAAVAETGADTGPADAPEADVGDPADTGADAGEPSFTEVCGQGYEWPEGLEPVPGSALLAASSIGLGGTSAELQLEGPAALRGPPDCWMRTPPGSYRARLFVDGEDVAELQLELEAETTTLLAVSAHPHHGTHLASMDFDFSPVELGRWRVQLLNLVPESFGRSLRFYTFPPGTPPPRPGQAVTAEATLVGTIPFGGSLHTSVPAGTEVHAFLADSSTITPQAAALPLTAEPCTAQRATIAHLVFCDSWFMDTDPGGPCAAMFGSSWYLNTLGGETCF